MTKVFNDIEELNTFLEGGKVVSNINFAAGMIQVTVCDQATQPGNIVTSEVGNPVDFKSVLDQIISDFSISTDSMNRYMLSIDDLESIAVYCGHYPRYTGECIVRHLYGHTLSSVTAKTLQSYLDLIRN